MVKKNVVSCPDQILEQTVVLVMIIVIENKRFFCWRQTGPSLPSNLWYKTIQIPKPECFSSRLVIVFSQSIEARC